MSSSPLKTSCYCILAATVLLSGCASQESPAITTVRSLVQGTLRPQLDSSVPNLDKRFLYLRVQYNQLPAVYMVLGFVDSLGPHTVHTWYSADGEVIKLRDGRIVGTVGLPHNWANVQYNQLPSWEALATGQPITYSRQRDSQADYAYNVKDAVRAVRRNDHASPLPIPYAAPQLPAAAWWIEETTPALPAAYVAMLPTTSGLTWIYSYQCLAPQVCLSLQPWPPVSPG